jgi:hypothetical protein
VQHLASIATSDHLPILLRREPVRVRGSAKRPFRYEVAWEGAEEFENKLKDSWLAVGRSDSLEDLQHKISNLSAGLSRWGCHSVGSVQAEIQSLQRELEALRTAPDRSDPSSTEQEIVAKLNSLLEQEEVMWRQRSRVQWLAAGDKNTRFFHLRASQRRRKKHITELVSSNGTVVTDGAVLGSMATEFYSDLYSS